MDKNRQKELGKAWRKASREDLANNLRRAKKHQWILFAAAVCVVLVVVTISLTPRRLVETVQGQAISQSASASKTSSGQWYATVHLENGATINLKLPKGEGFRLDAPMRIKYYRRQIGPIAYESWVFAGYAQAAR